MKRGDVKTSMLVRFHPIIGGKHDGNLYTVRCVGSLYGQDVAWLEGKAGCVDLKALSRPMPGTDNYGLGQDG